MAESNLTDLVARLERERVDADRRYNEALTALDAAIQRDEPTMPIAPTDSGMHAAATRALIELTRREFESRARVEARLIRYLQTITAFVETKDRAIGGTELREQIAMANERTMALSREMERRRGSGVPDVPEVPRFGIAAGAGGEASEPRTPGTSGTSGTPEPASLHAFKYLGFEDRFRGTREEIRARLADYVPIFAGATSVLDVGCGRGEMLELLAEARVDARGVDANERMASFCRERGLRVDHGDAVAYLRAQPDASLGGLIAIQVVEHLPPDHLMAFLEAAHHALAPGAPIVLETINPACWMAFFETFLRDLTHARPLHADTLKFLMEASGFTRVEVTYRAPVSERDRLPRVAVPPSADDTLRAIAGALNAHADALNARLFSSMDYAVVARR